MTFYVALPTLIHKWRGYWTTISDFRKRNGGCTSPESEWIEWHLPDTYSRRHLHAVWNPLKTTLGSQLLRQELKIDFVFYDIQSKEYLQPEEALSLGAFLGSCSMGFYGDKNVLPSITTITIHHYEIDQVVRDMFLGHVFSHCSELVKFRPFKHRKDYTDTQIHVLSSLDAVEPPIPVLLCLTPQGTPKPIGFPVIKTDHLLGWKPGVPKASHR